MKTQMTAGLGRSREVECHFSPGMLSLTGKCCFFHSDNTDSPGRKYMNEKNFEVETWLHIEFTRCVS